MEHHLAAQHRKQLLEDISNGSVEDKQLFYRLVNKQRGGCLGVASNIDFGMPCKTQLDGWVNYFEGLATATSLPQFDNKYYMAR